MIQPPNYKWDSVKGAYRQQGRFAKKVDALEAADKYLDAKKDTTADALFDLMREGQVGVKDAQLLFERELSKAHIASGMAAMGGKSQMSFSVYGRIGSEIKPELGHARDLFKELGDGRPLDGTVRQSFRAYFANAANTFILIQGLEMEKRGFDEEAYDLDDGAHHCSSDGLRPSCPEVERRGFQKRGTHPRRGGCACRWGCKCKRKYKNSVTGEIR